MTSPSTGRPTYDNYPAWWREHGEDFRRAYQENQRSFVAGLLPEEAIKMRGVDLLQLLYGRLGGQLLQQCLVHNYETPKLSTGEGKFAVDSPVIKETSTEWLNSSKTVGINVRTVGNFFNVVKYALTLPAHIDCIHLLPIWEAGVVASLYGIASKRINPEFFSHELAIQFPELNTVEKQLRVTINFLHAMGKKVGMDVIPHTDRYSEIVLANPHFFEWLHRNDLRITDHSEAMTDQAELAILSWLRNNGPATGDLSDIWNILSQDRFFRQIDEDFRLELLFGQAGDYEGRQARRISLVDHLYQLGLEPVPATMAPPYRGLEVDPDPAAMTIDDAGREWRDYRISHPQEMSRVFGPLTRFKLYGRKDDNQNWQIDFDQPRPAVWEYVQNFYAGVQAEYGFDFMRGDMSHVQMRPGGVPAVPDPDFYDLLASVKQRIQQQAPYFGYFAESFLAPDNYMAYGNEVDHLEASRAEVTLGNLQSFATDEPDFHAELRKYLDIASTRSLKPAFAVITGDKDDPRFDKFYLHGNAARMFFALFMPTLPAYYALGFEQRDIHPQPAPNEKYTKLYVFQLQDGPKATHGPYQWGHNTDHFFQLDRLHQYAEQILPSIAQKPVTWLINPDATGGRQYCCWEIGDYIFIINFSNSLIYQLRIPYKQDHATDYTLFFSTLSIRELPTISFSEGYLTIDTLLAGEGMVLSRRGPQDSQ